MDYSCMTHAAIEYRREADRYAALSDRYQKQANTEAATLGENSPEVQSHRKLAQQYLVDSEQADALARQFRRELPHGMMH